ncbi:DUF1275 family protein [Williamsia sp.]|uniref:DUF1275 family protein n=1 Tax=Williamsia sp. TaxID=1872085 RepID=UPI001A34EB62|nr:DUF1275 family protein [Williamsia sp.]MBJ7290938.1 DUF1275 family protein [Williamsia sp.]
MSPTSRPSAIAFAGLLGAVSGAVDVLVFTRLGEVFASVITGNVVVVGVAIGGGHLGVMSHAAIAVGCYAIGVIVATLMTRRHDEHPARGAATPVILVYGFEFTLLCGLATIWVATGGRPGGVAQFAALALTAAAMGMQGRAFAMDRLPGVTTTYFTGTLTNLLTGLVTDSTVNRAAAVALMSLLAGAAASGALVSVAPIAAPALPLVLLAAGLVMVGVRWHRHADT